MSNAVTLYGKSGSYHGYAGVTVLPNGQTFGTSDISGFALDLGKILSWSEFTDGKLFIVATDPSNLTQPTGTSFVVYIWDPAGNTWQTVYILSSTGLQSALMDNGLVGGAGGSDILIVGSRVYALTAVPYNGWQISPTNGVYPVLGSLKKTGGTWGYDSATSYTADQMHAASGLGALAWPNQTNSYGETYAYSELAGEMETAPASGVILIAQYAIPPDSSYKTSSIVAIDPATGNTLARFYPSFGPLADVDTINLRNPQVDPTGTLGNEVLVCASDCFKSGGDAGKNYLFFFNYDDNTHTITQLSQPLASPAGSDHWTNGGFDSNGWLYWDTRQGLFAKSTIIMPKVNGAWQATRNEYAFSGTDVAVRFRPAFSSKSLVNFTQHRMRWDQATSSMLIVTSTGKLEVLNVTGSAERPKFIRYSFDLGLQTYFAGVDLAQPQDMSIDATGRMLYIPVRQWDSSLSWPQSPVQYESWIYGVDLEQTARFPVFLNATNGQKLLGTSMTVSLPTNSEGDTCVVLVAVNVGVFTDQVITGPDGWRKLDEFSQSSASGAVQLAVFAKTLHGDSNPAFTWTRSLNASYVAATYRGADIIYPANREGHSGGESTTMSRPSVTPSVTGCRVLGLYASHNNTSFSGLSGEVSRTSHASGPNTLLTEEFNVASLSATSSRTVTLGASSGWGGVTLLIAPVAARGMIQGANVAGTISDIIIGEPQGQVSHEFVGPGGSVTCVVGNWEANEEAPGGFMSGAGDVPKAVVLANPNVFVDGAVWRTYLAETSEVVSAGTLLDPVLDGNLAHLAHQGWGKLLANQADRLLWCNENYGDWSSRDSDPYDFSNEAAEFTLDPAGGKLSWKISNGQTYADGAQAGFAFWAQNAIITQITFTYHKTADAGSFVLRILGHTGPNGSGTTIQDIDLSSSGPADGTTETITISSSTSAYDMISIIVKNTSGGPVSPNASKTIYLNNMAVLGMASSTDYAGWQVISDLAGLVGASTAGLSQVGSTVMPLDVQQGTYADAANLVNALTDTRTLLVDQGWGPDVDHGGWDKRVWYPAVLTDPIRPVPLPRYDSVRVTWTYSNNNARGILVVSADVPLVQPRTYAIDLSQPYPDSSMPQALAQAALGVLYQSRYGGDFSLSAVRDQGGNVRSPKSMRAGDLLYVPAADSFQRIKSLRHLDGHTEGQFDESIAALDKLVASSELAATRS